MPVTRYILGYTPRVTPGVVYTLGYTEQLAPEVAGLKFYGT